MLLIFAAMSLTISAEILEKNIIGDEIIVDDEGDGDYSSIQEAIDNANPGDIIKVYSGTYDDILYPDSIIIDKSLILEGVSEEYGLGNDSGKPIIDGYNGAILTISEADFVTVDGFQLGSLKIIRSSNITISSNVLKSRRDHGGEEGISINYGKNIQIYRNSLRNHFHALSIYVEANSQIKVIQNNFINNIRHSKFRISGWSSTDNTSVNNSIVYSENFWGADLSIWEEDHIDSWDRFIISNILFYYIFCKRPNYQTFSLSQKFILGKIQLFDDESTIDITLSIIFSDKNPATIPYDI
jgi:hypothetical protein